VWPLPALLLLLHQELLLLCRCAAEHCVLLLQPLLVQACRMLLLYLLLLLGCSQLAQLLEPWHTPAAAAAAATSRHCCQQQPLHLLQTRQQNVGCRVARLCCRVCLQHGWCGLLCSSSAAQAPNGLHTVTYKAFQHTGLPDCKQLLLQLRHHLLLLLLRHPF
jgi:hypothetical protein